MAHRLSVNVILPYHNRPLLVKGFANIIKQSYKNFELILVDDNSRDKLNIEQINFEDIPVQHIVNEVNLGANQSRLIGLRHSKGKYVCFMMMMTIG